MLISDKELAQRTNAGLTVSQKMTQKEKKDRATAGGLAAAKALSKEDRKKRAKKAAEKRWSKKKPTGENETA